MKTCAKITKLHKKKNCPETQTKTDTTKIFTRIDNHVINDCTKTKEWNFRYKKQIIPGYTKQKLFDLITQLFMNHPSMFQIKVIN